MSWPTLDKENLPQPSSASTLVSENSWPALWLPCPLWRLIFLWRLKPSDSQPTVHTFTPHIFKMIFFYLTIIYLTHKKVVCCLFVYQITKHTEVVIVFPGLQSYYLKKKIFIDLDLRLKIISLIVGLLFVNQYSLVFIFSNSMSC